MGTLNMRSVLLLVYFAVLTSNQPMTYENDYVYLFSTDSYYKVHLAMTWKDAVNTCKKEGAILFHPESNQEASVIMTFWKRYYTYCDITGTNINLEILVGLNDRQVEGVFETVDGRSTNWVYSNWAQGEPNNYGGNEDCVVFRCDETLNDVDCLRKFPFICSQHDDYTYLSSTESYYKYHGDTPWVEATETCQAEGAILYYPEDYNEARQVMAMWHKSRPYSAQYWVGLNDRDVKGVFETVDGRTINEVYINWAWKQPNNAEDEHCVVMRAEGTINLIDCKSEEPYICKKV